MTKKLFITCHNMSGIAAHIINVMYGKKYCDEIIVGPNYNKTNYLDDYDEITCVDIVPFNEEQYNELINKGKKIFIYDHHLSNEWCLKYPNCIINEYKCGAKSYFESLNVQEYKEAFLNYIDIINAYNTWDVTSKYFDNLSQYYYYIFDKKVMKPPYHDKIINLNHKFNYRVYVDEMIDKIKNNNIKEFTDSERYIIDFRLRRQQKELYQANKYIKYFVDKRNIKYGYYEMLVKDRYTLYKMLQNNKNKMEYILIYNPKRNIISVYSIDFNVSTLDNVKGGKYIGKVINIDSETMNKLKSGEISL